MVKKKANTGESKPNYEDIGHRIVEAVGLPAEIFANNKEIGKAVIYLCNLSIRVASTPGYRRKYHVEQYQSEAANIASEIMRITKRLEKLNSVLPDDAMRGIFEELGIEYSFDKAIRLLREASDEFQFHIPALINDAEPFIMPCDNFTVLIGREFYWNYKFYFGIQAPVREKNCCDEAQYKGPFIRFSRFILDMAGVDLSDAAIVKYPKRYNEEVRKSSTRSYLKD